MSDKQAQAPSARPGWKTQWPIFVDLSRESALALRSTTHLCHLCLCTSAHERESSKIITNTQTQSGICSPGVVVLVLRVLGGGGGGFRKQVAANVRTEVCTEGA